MMNTYTSDPRRWAALFLLCLVQLLVILDTSRIGVALPAIQGTLGVRDNTKKTKTEQDEKNGKGQIDAASR